MLILRYLRYNKEDMTFSDRKHDQYIGKVAKKWFSDNVIHILQTLGPCLGPNLIRYL
jgi:hypothetical protein